MASVRSSQPKPSSDATPSCFSSFFFPLSTSNCHAGRRVRKWPSRWTSSATSTSAGAIRVSSFASAWGAISATRSVPLASESQASPTVDLLLESERRMLSALSSRRAESVSVPGVTIRVTCRSTGPFASAGSPICSQIATDSPSFTSFARYCSTECTGTPAIFTGAPADAPRCVSVMSSSRDARSASS